MSLELPHLEHWDKLEPSEQKFVVLVLESRLPYYKAYREAGYGSETTNEGTLMSCASAKWRSPKIQSAVKEITAVFGMEAWQVLKVLRETVLVSIGDICEWIPKTQADGTPVLDEEGEPILIPVPSLGKIIDSGYGHLVEEISYTKYGPKVKFVSKTSAISLLMEHLGMRGKNPSGSADDPNFGVQLTLDEWKKLRQDRLDQVDDVMRLFPPPPEGYEEPDDDEEGPEPEEP